MKVIAFLTGLHVKFCSATVLHFFQVYTKLYCNIGTSSAPGRQKSLTTLINDEVTKATPVKPQRDSLNLRMAIFLVKEVNASH